MKKCNCYETIEKIHYNSILQNSYYKNVGICNGTKEREECSCGGDRTKCDFYPDVREEANKELKRGKTWFENIKEMSIDEMAKFFSADSYPNLPHSACYICQYDCGILCKKPDDCTKEYETELYKKWLNEKSNDEAYLKRYI